MRRKIAIFGGSFDPIHIVHVLTMEYVLQTEDVDELWVIPCFKHNLGKEESAPFEHRCEMCRLAVRDKPKVRVSTIEESLGPPSRTLVTINKLREQNPDDEFKLVVGSDLLSELPTWYGYEELMKSTPFIVVPRGGYATMSGFSLPEMSSTQIRTLIRNGGFVSALIPRSVDLYIYRHQLYLELQEGGADGHQGNRDRP